MDGLEVDPVEELVAHEIVHVSGAQPELRIHGKKLTD